MSDTSGQNRPSDDPGDETRATDASADVEHSDAPIDQMSDQPQAGAEQNAPLPDWGPTDGVHGTDADPE